MKCAREDFIRFEPQHAATKAEAGLMTAGKTLPKKEAGPEGDRVEEGQVRGDVMWHVAH